MCIAENAGPEPLGDGTSTFTGPCWFSISPEEGIKPLARISTGEALSCCYRYLPWTRGVFMGNNIYAVTNATVLAVPRAWPNRPPSRLDLQP
jgi:hypothetical protein